MHGAEASREHPCPADRESATRVSRGAVVVGVGVEEVVVVAVVGALDVEMMSSLDDSRNTRRVYDVETTAGGAGKQK